MKYPGVLPTSARFEWKYERIPHPMSVPVPPEDPAPVHAMRKPPERWSSRYDSAVKAIAANREPFIVDGGLADRAACGKRVKVYWPGTFDSSDPDACKECCEDLWLEQHNPERWRIVQEQRRESEAYWSRKDAERRDLQEYQGAEFERQAYELHADDGYDEPDDTPKP